MENTTFFSNFDRTLEKKKLLDVGDRYLIVQWDEECVKKYGRFGTIIEIYSNPNTGNAVHVFQYEDKVFGPDDEMDCVHDWAREIITGNCKYSLWLPAKQDIRDIIV